jgi:hypothetical protein
VNSFFKSGVNGLEKGGDYCRFFFKQGCKILPSSARELSDQLSGPSCSFSQDLLFSLSAFFLRRSPLCKSHHSVVVEKAKFRFNDDSRVKKNDLSSQSKMNSRLNEA